MDRFTTSDGLSLAYDDRGEGLALLCLAGLTRNMGDFEPVLDRFGDRARIIRLDGRGRGASDWDENFLNYDPRVEARDALELLDHLKIGKTAVLGTSRGGMLAMALALAAPERLAGIILNDIGPVIEEGGLDKIKGYLGLPPPHRTLAEAAEAMARDYAPAFPGLGPQDWMPWVRNTYEETGTGLRLRYDPKLRDALMKQSESGVLPNLWPLFDALAGIPVALIRGQNSDLLSAETAAEMRERRPDMIFREVPGRGHVPFLDEPEAVDAIGELLEAARRAAGQQAA